MPRLEDHWYGLRWEEAEESASNREDWRRSVCGPMCL